MSDHAKLSPSKAGRWTVCPGSVREEARYPDIQSPYAAEGEGAHLVAEKVLRGESSLEALVGQTLELPARDGAPGGRVLITSEMAKAVGHYLDWCFELLILGEHTWIESKVEALPGVWGTADFMSLEGAMLDIADYKHGAGVKVEVEENVQLSIYGLGGLREVKSSLPEREVEEVRLTIVQPRVGGNPRKQVTLQARELLLWGSGWLAPRVAATQDPNAPLVPGDHCKFCKHAAKCPALAGESLALARSEFGRVEPRLPDPWELSDDQLREVLSKAGMIESWLKSVHRYVEDRLRLGQSFPGYKLVDKRGTRQWLDERALLEWAKQAGIDRSRLYLEPKLRSPNQLEGELGFKHDAPRIPKDLVAKESSGVTLAPENDPRPRAVVGSEFTKVYLEEDEP